MRYVACLTVAIASLLSSLSIAGVSAAEEAAKIRLNTIGYLPGKEKKASIAAECSVFAVVRRQG